MLNNGFFLVNKPFGWTSFDVVQKIKNKFNIKKAGHAGTLDPVATGLLIVLVGNYTKYFVRFMELEKTYFTKILLGASSDTDDIEGKIEISEGKKVEECKQLFDVRLNEFLSSKKGKIYQRVPRFSSVKVNGRPLYYYARRGLDIDLPKKEVELKDVKIEKIDYPIVSLSISSGKGFYVRSFARDMGEFFGIGGLMLFLKRIKIGKFDVKDAKMPEDLVESDLRKF